MWLELTEQTPTTSNSIRYLPLSPFDLPLLPHEGDVGPDLPLFPVGEVGPDLPDFPVQISSRLLIQLAFPALPSEGAVGPDFPLFPSDGAVGPFPLFPVCNPVEYM